MRDADQARRLLRAGSFPDPTHLRPETTMTNTTQAVTESLDEFAAAARELAESRDALAAATARTAAAAAAYDDAVQSLGEAVRGDAGREVDTTRLVDGATVYTVRVTRPGNPSHYDVTSGPARAVVRN